MSTSVKGELETEIKAIVSGAYDLQKTRISCGNRVCASFRAKVGILSGITLNDLDLNADISDLDDDTKKKNKLISLVYSDYRDLVNNQLIVKYPQINKKITDEILIPRVYSVWKNLEGGKIISDFAEFVLINSYHNNLANEKRAFTELKKVLEMSNSFYREYLGGVRGVGEALAGVILSTINIYKAQYPSSLWKFAGYDVVRVVDKDGNIKNEGRGKKEGHLIDRPYIDKKGNPATKKSITYNPWLKTKMKILADSLLRCKSDLCQPHYYDYKEKLMKRPEFKDNLEKEKSHIHNMARRHLIKGFLAEALYVPWRKHEGLPVSIPYAERMWGK